MINILNPDNEITMKLSDDTRKAIHDWRWGPYIHDPVERQDADDKIIKKVIDTFNQLESENNALRKIIRDWSTIEINGKKLAIEALKEVEHPLV